MCRIDLQEYVTSEPVRLAAADRDEFRDILPSLTIEPAFGTEDEYCLTPGSVIGALEIGELAVSIRPKLNIARVLFLASYAMGAFKLQEMDRFDFKDAPTIVEALAAAFAAAARRAFASGLLHGYRAKEDALLTVRGRIRFNEQIRRQFGVPLPLAVRYDEFTDDILVNRLVKAAAVRLGRMRLRCRRSRTDLRRVCATLDNVSLVEFPAIAVPEVTFDRLSEHYRGVVVLSRLILRNTSVETTRGDIRAPGFLIDMNQVFQGFVTQALREALCVSKRTFRSDNLIRHIPFDEEGRVRLKPDLSWWDGLICTFVGDAKYKRINEESIPNADLYQLFAYATALGLPGGLLIYAQGDLKPVSHRVQHVGTRLEAVALDLSGTVDDLLARIKQLARRVRALRELALQRNNAV